MLRLTAKGFKELVDAGFLLPVTRLDGRLHYTDWAVYRAIHFLYPEISPEESAAIKRQLGAYIKKRGRYAKRKKRPKSEEASGER